MEGGAEADTNVKRVETGSNAMSERIAAPVGRAGARIDHKDTALGGSYGLELSGLARMVASSAVSDENIMLYAGDAHWLRPIGAQPITAGISVTGADASAITGKHGARTFRNLGGDGVLVLGGEDRHLTLAVGGRAFTYKPDHAFDWRGLSATARLDLELWEAADKTRSLELAAGFGFEPRSYTSIALRNGCAPGAEPSDLCSRPTSLIRRDRYQRAGIDARWIGGVVATAGYQLTVIDSNSYGQSLIRHRLTASATAELPHRLFGTVTATIQIDQYPDGILVETDAQRQEFTNLDDENRSSLQLRLARELTTAWSIEARAAMWRDLGSAAAASFRRELIYTGIVYSR
jgi:hypothetical protein